MIKYKKGNIVKGIVTGIEKYGIFVSLDNSNNGLVHISEISESFVRNPSDFVSVGDQIKVLIIEDQEESSSQVKLSIKNIDYQDSKKKAKKIIETANGFSSLRSYLPRWIEYKKEKISKK